MFAGNLQGEVKQIDQMLGLNDGIIWATGPTRTNARWATKKGKKGKKGKKNKNGQKPLKFPCSKTGVLWLEPPEGATSLRINGRVKNPKDYSLVVSDCAHSTGQGYYIIYYYIRILLLCHFHSLMQSQSIDQLPRFIVTVISRSFNMSPSN